MMQGYILSFHRVKDEDLIVTILTSDSLLTLYRFYGARHSTINIGYKIDFEVQEGEKSHISRLRNIRHIGTPWLANINKMMIWQQVSQLFYRHLRENETLENFYFDLFETMLHKWQHQNPKRIAIESYAELLDFEGRLHLEMHCFLCGLPIKEKPALVRAFLPTHTYCSYAKPVDQKKLVYFLETKESLSLSDSEVNHYYQVMLEGL